MRSWLTDELVESLVWSLPVRSLHTEEGCKGDSYGESQHPAVGCALYDRTHEREAGQPADAEVGDELSGELLELPAVELLHLDDLVVSEVIIVNIS